MIPHDCDYKKILHQPLLQLVANQPKDNIQFFEDFSRRDLNILLDLSHRQLTSLLLFRACLFRNESRGGHFRNDAPASVPYWECHSRQKIGESISIKVFFDTNFILFSNFPIR